MLLANGKCCYDDKGRQHIVRFAVIIIYISSRYSAGSVFLKHKESDLFSFGEHESLT